MVRPSASGAADQAGTSSQTPKSTAKGAAKATQQQAPSTPKRQVKPDVFEQSDAAKSTVDEDGDEEGEEDEYEDDETEQGQAEDPADAGAAEEKANGGTSKAKSAAGGAKDAAGGAAGKAGKAAAGAGQGAQGKVTETVDQKKDQAKETADGAGEGEAEEDGEGEGGDDEEAVPIGSVAHDGSVVNESGSKVGSLSKGDPKNLEGSIVDDVGDVLDNEGNVVGEAAPNADGAVDGVGEKADEAGEKVGDAGEKAAEAGDKTGEAGDEAGKKAGDLGGEAGGLDGKAGELGEKATEAAAQLPTLGLPGPLDFGGKDGRVTDAAGNPIGKLTEGDPAKLADGVKDMDGEGQLLGEDGSVLGRVKLDDAEKLKEAAPKLPVLEIAPLEFRKGGRVLDRTGTFVGKLTEGDPKELGEEDILGVNERGEILSQDGTVLGKIKLDDFEKLKESVPILPVLNLGPLEFKKGGKVSDGSGNVIGKLKEGDPKQLAEEDVKGVNEKGELIAEDGSVLGKVKFDNLERLKELISPILEIEYPLHFQKGGNVANGAGNVIGKLSKGDPTKLSKEDIKGVNEQGELVGEDGTILGKVELEDLAKLKGQLPELQVFDLEGPLDFKKDGTVSDKTGNVIGKLVEGNAKQLIKEDVTRVNEQGDLLGDDGTVFGKVELADLEKLKALASGQISNIPSPEILQGKKVNKTGKVVDEQGGVWGKVIEGDPEKMAGRICDALGQIWNDSGKVIGKAEALPEEDREVGGESPFESFPGAKCHRNGDVVYEGEVVGKIIEGDLKVCEGKEVDKDGDISDKHGNTVGKAERYVEPELEEEEKVDQSALAGKRVNKQGNVVDEKGSLFGKVVEGELKSLIGKMCDKDGNIWNEAGEVIGRADILPEAMRETKKEGPFAPYEGAKVYKDGFVRSAQDEVIGKLIEGDPKKLAGYAVDEEGDVLDSTGNLLGKCERYDEPEEEKKHHPCAGFKVNSEGNVIDDNGDIIGKLTSGDLEACRGMEIDDDGDISNQKGQSIGHVTRIADCKPEKTQEELDAEEAERIAAEEAEKDKKLTNAISYRIDEGIEKIKPIMREITNLIDNAEATPEDERDEEKLVKDVKPLIEQAAGELEDINHDVRGMDPDGRIQTQAKTKAASREATPEEYRLAELLKTLTGEIETTIENAKKKLAGMPHARDSLNPLWGLLTEPLFQILAAVGLLLNGVLGLVGRLLGGLGLGGIVNHLLGSLGLDKIMKSILGKKK